MDVIPAHTYGSVIRITDHNEDDNTYDYLGSNPAGYVKWFFDACAKQRNRLYEQYIKDHRTVVAQADVEDVKRRKVKHHYNALYRFLNGIETLSLQMTIAVISPYQL